MTPEEDQGGGGDAPEAGTIGEGCLQECPTTVAASEIEKSVAHSGAGEQSPAPSLGGLVIESDSGAQAEEGGPDAMTGDGEAAAVEREGVDLVVASAPLDKRRAAPPDADADNDEDEDEDEGQEEREEGARECFVGGLPPEATEEDLRSLFADLSPLSVRVNRRKKGSGDCKGYGFVVFPSAELAKRACERETTTVRNVFFFFFSKIASFTQARSRHCPRASRFRAGWR